MYIGTLFLYPYLSVGRVHRPPLEAVGEDYFVQRVMLFCLAFYK